VVLLLLALIWGALLVSWLRSRSSTSFTDSVGTFRRDLKVLERTTPLTVRPANRLSDPASIRRSPGPSVRSGTIGAPIRRQMPLAASSGALRRRQVQKRRRDVFFALMAGTAGSLALALIPGLSIMWSVQVLFDILTVGYVSLLVHLRNRAAEREMKLRHIRPNTVVPHPRPTYSFAAGYGDIDLRRAATH
jgi:hypothetical protein